MRNNDVVAIDNQTLLAVERELYSRSFVDFAKRAWQEIDPAPLVHNWHFDAICEHLQALGTGDKRCRQLLINVPPGTAKSMIVGVLFPAWMWTHRPDWKALSLSHNHNQAIRDTRKSRLLIKSKWYQDRWPTDFLDDQDQKGSYENTSFGSRHAIPFSSATGNRGNCIIVDDPHSVDEAKSEAERTSRVETFFEALSNRLNDMINDTVLVIMQRLHEEDVAGEIIARELGFTHLFIPMEYEGDSKPTTIGWKDPRKKLGELMFPQKFPRDVVEQLKKKLGPTVYAGQYQQRPTPKEAGELDIAWFKETRFKLGQHPKGCNYYMTSDHAPSGNNDFNVFRIWAIDHKRDLWLVDSFRKQCKMPEALGIKRNADGRLEVLQHGALYLVKKWKPIAFYPEDDNNWKSVGDMFIQAMREAKVHTRIKPQPTSGLGDKVVKAQSYCTLASLGQIHLPHGPIGEIALAEYAKFPAGKHDDQVDADGMIARVYDQLRPGTNPEGFNAELASIKDYKPIRAANDDDAAAFWP